jgi:polygalacturonase
MERNTMERTKLITIACLIASNQESNVFNPKAYGAVGDGVTNDTAAFASVVAAAKAVHGIVQIPAETYLATIAVTEGGITIQGAGKKATNIKAPNTAAASAAGRVVVVAESDHTTIKDLTIDGNKSARSGKSPATAR